MGRFREYFVNVKKGTKITYSESDLRKLDRTYEKEVYPSDRKKVMSSFRKVPQQAYLTQVRDYAFEKILDNHMYTFQHILVIPNPYDLVKQSALLLFNSSKETKVRYRVIGDTPEADFTAETEYTKRHRVPVLGLYLARSNKVELEMLDMDGNVVKRRLLRIYVSESARNEEEIIGKTDNKQLSQFKFIMVNGVAFDPIVVDTNGAIRYSIQLRSKRIGMIPLANGHFLYEDKTANRMSKSGEFRPCRYHEMDYLGRVYRTFLLDFQVLGIAAQKDELLYLNVQDEEDTEKEQVIALNLSNGEIIRDAVLPDEEDSFQGKLCRPLKKNAKNRKQGGILSADGTRMLSCADYRGERKKGKKACLMETDTSNGQVLNRMVLQRAVSLIWKFEPDMLSFCVPAEKKEDVIFGTLLPPERFDGTLPPLEEKAIERIYFSGVRLCDDLFICYILPGRIDKIYFIGENNKYVQDYVGMRVKNAKVSFVISMADFAVDEYCVYVESRNAVHRLKNIIRVVE